MTWHGADTTSVATRRARTNGEERRYALPALPWAWVGSRDARSAGLRGARARRHMPCHVSLYAVTLSTTLSMHPCMHPAICLSIRKRSLERASERARESSAQSTARAALTGPSSRRPPVPRAGTPACTVASRARGPRRTAGGVGGLCRQGRDLSARHAASPPANVPRARRVLAADTRVRAHRQREVGGRGGHDPVCEVQEVVVPAVGASLRRRRILLIARMAPHLPKTERRRGATRHSGAASRSRAWTRCPAQHGPAPRRPSMRPPAGMTSQAATVRRTSGRRRGRARTPPCMHGMDARSSPVDWNASTLHSARRSSVLCCAATAQIVMCAPGHDARDVDEHACAERSEPIPVTPNVARCMQRRLYDSTTVSRGTKGASRLGAETWLRGRTERPLATRTAWSRAAQRQPARARRPAPARNLLAHRQTSQAAARSSDDVVRAQTRSAIEKSGQK
jgi:hypothetical protein